MTCLAPTNRALPDPSDQNHIQSVFSVFLTFLILVIGFRLSLPSPFMPQPPVLFREERTNLSSLRSAYLRDKMPFKKIITHAPVITPRFGNQRKFEGRCSRKQVGKLVKR